ncbi:MAG: small, acid-soluble spore protein, alpha/beta type [Thermacetogeniaceae bacterium]
MPEKTPKKKAKKKASPHEQLKWETARELGLDDDLARAGDELTVREAGKIGGQMVKKLIKAGEEALSRQEDQNQP